MARLSRYQTRSGYRPEYPHPVIIDKEIMPQPHNPFLFSIALQGLQTFNRVDVTGAVKSPNPLCWKRLLSMAARRPNWNSTTPCDAPTIFSGMDPASLTDQPIFPTGPSWSPRKTLRLSPQFSGCVATIDCHYMSRRTFRQGKCCECFANMPGFHFPFEKIATHINLFADTT